MKKLLLLSSFISFASISAFSQIAKGGFLVGGNVNFTSAEHESLGDESKTLFTKYNPILDICFR